MQELTDEQRKELADALALAQDTGLQTADWAAQRLRAVIVVGRALNEWRGRIRSGWAEWLASNVLPLASVTRRSLNNWQRLALAESEGRIDIASGKGVRAAMQQAGIIPPPDRGQNEARIFGPAAAIAALLRSVRQVLAAWESLDSSQRRTALAAARELAGKS